MPLVGVFHDRFWKARANGAQAQAPHDPMYPEWQSTIQQSFTLSMAIWAVPGDALYPFRLWCQRAWAAWVRFYRLRPWTLSGEQFAVLEHVTQLVTSEPYETARQDVRTCANQKAFNREEHWIPFGRAMKASNRGAENTFRHLSALQALRSRHWQLSSPDANLLVELAYHGFRLTGRDHARIIDHPKRHVEHRKRYVAH